MRPLGWKSPKDTLHDFIKHGVTYVWQTNNTRFFAHILHFSIIVWPSGKAFCHFEWSREISHHHVVHRKWEIHSRAQDQSDIWPSLFLKSQTSVLKSALVRLTVSSSEVWKSESLKVWRNHSHFERSEAKSRNLTPPCHPPFLILFDQIGWTETRESLRVRNTLSCRAMDWQESACFQNFLIN